MLYTPFRYLLLARLVSQIIQFAEWSQQFSSSLLLFHAAVGVAICHQAISGSSGWWKLGSPAVYGLQSGLLCGRYRVVTVLSSSSSTYVSSAGTETQNHNLLCSVKFVVVARDLLSPEAVFNDRLFFCQRDGLSCCVMPAPLFASLSAMSFPLIPQWTGIHCNTTLLFSR